MTKTADDLRIFYHLAASEKPLTTNELAEKTGASPSLTGETSPSVGRKKPMNEKREWLN